MSSPNGYPRLVEVSVRVYRTLLWAYPSDFRTIYGEEMVRCFQDLSSEALADSGILALIALWLRTLPELLSTSIRERNATFSRKVFCAASSIALAAGLTLGWMSLGVGIIGKDGNLANLMYFGVLAVGITGSLIARFRSAGMARAVFAMAAAQAVVAGIALTAKLGFPWSGPLELITLNGFFIIVFAGSAFLFRYAAHKQRIQTQPAHTIRITTTI